MCVYLHIMAYGTLLVYYYVQESVPLWLPLGGDAHPGRSENGAYGSLREGVGLVVGRGCGGGGVMAGCGSGGGIRVHLDVHLVFEGGPLDVAGSVGGSGDPGEEEAFAGVGHFILEAVGL